MSFVHIVFNLYFDYICAICFRSMLLNLFLEHERLIFPSDFLVSVYRAYSGLQVQGVYKISPRF